MQDKQETLNVEYLKKGYQNINNNTGQIGRRKICVLFILKKWKIIIIIKI